MYKNLIPRIITPFYGLAQTDSALDDGLSDLIGLKKELFNPDNEGTLNPIVSSETSFYIKTRVCPASELLSAEVRKNVFKQKWALISAGEAVIDINYTTGKCSHINSKEVGSMQHTEYLLQGAFTYVPNSLSIVRKHHVLKLTKRSGSVKTDVTISLGLLMEYFHLV